MKINELRDSIRNSDLELSSQIIGDVETKNVFNFHVPHELADRTDFTTVLITELGNNYDEYGGNEPRIKVNDYQIQIYYVENTDYEKFESQLDKLLRSAGYLQTKQFGHDLDEDTGQLMTTIYYTG